MTDGSGAARGSRKTWISVLIAAVIIVGILAAAAIGGTAFFFYRHIQSEPAQRETAAQQFAAARARFADQKPLIEIRRGDEPVLHRELIPNATAGRPLQTLRVLAYDPDGGKIVRIAIPMWLLRLAPGSRRMSFLSDNGIDFDSDRVHLTLDDLERRGPGLLVDHTDRHGSLVLVWTE